MTRGREGTPPEEHGVAQFESGAFQYLVIGSYKAIAATGPNLSSMPELPPIREAGTAAVSRGAAMSLALFVAILGGSGLLAAAALAQDPDQDDPRHPRRHFRIENPAGLRGEDAQAIYERIRDDMVAGYRLSGVPYAGSYRYWRRYNTTPYRSAQHGERYINNYANETARDYGRFEAAGVLPVGSILAKDSFAVTARGDVFSGPLFVMEKMPAGFDPPARDWRYTMIMPDGSIFGITGGEGSEKVAFCTLCHGAAGKSRDHLFFVPKALRVRTSE